ncbi:transposase [Streptomyces europaeiscabiei]|uniref:transposase n=1 Tax=Streptomyces europaeiscabiei TaxID=146819 RepID=UPI0038D3F47B
MGQRADNRPNGHTATSWRVNRSEEGLPMIRVRFSRPPCRPCPDRARCINSPNGIQRELNLRPREEPRPPTGPCCPGHRRLEGSLQISAGAEGAISQAVQVCDLHICHYRGLGDTSLQRRLTGAAVNLIRINARLTSTPRAHHDPAPAPAPAPVS